MVRKVDRTPGTGPGQKHFWHPEYDSRRSRVKGFFGRIVGIMRRKRRGKPPAKEARPEQPKDIVEISEAGQRAAAEAEKKEQ